MIESMSRRNYILLKIKVRLMNDSLVVLRSNYDFQGLIAYHDQAIITQLFIDLRTLEVVVFFFVEHNIFEDVSNWDPRNMSCSTSRGKDQNPSQG